MDVGLKFFDFILVLYVAQARETVRDVKSFKVSSKKILHICTHV